MNRIKLLVCTGLVTLFAGCAVDNLQILSQPDQVKPGDVVEINMVTLINIVNPNSQSLFFPIYRDSIHLGCGLPADWKIESVDYFYAPDMKLANLVMAMEDPAQLQAVLGDSLTRFYDDKTPLPEIPGQETFFTGKTFQALDPQTMENTPVEGSAAESWHCFGTAIGLSVSRTDTIFVLGDTTSAVSAMVPVDSSITVQGMSIDSAGISSIPVFFSLRLTAGESVGDIPLYFYSKSGALPETISADPAADLETNPSALDVGSFIVTSVNVNPSNAVVSRNMSTLDADFRIIHRQGQVLVTTGSPGQHRAILYRANGSIVTRAPVSRQTPWTLPDAVAPGQYFLRMNGTTISLPLVR